MTSRENEDRDLATTVDPAPARLGSAEFRQLFGVGYAYMAGAMAKGISSEDLVAALARAGYLGSFGAAGLRTDRVAGALDRFAREIPGLPFAVNVIHSPGDPGLERDVVELCLARAVRLVEASAYLNLTPHIVRYRVAGLGRGPDGTVTIANRIIAKVSRPEVAGRFLRPAPEPLVARLLSAGLVSAEQAELARRVPMADSITAEADSAGHTDRRPLTVLLPILLRLRVAVARECGFAGPALMGAAGGIGTPEAAAAAFAMRADYVVTGSVNQACVEAGVAPETKRILAEAGIADYDMAPSADMFELGAGVQVLKRGTAFPMRARRLYELYRAHESLESLPAEELRRLERDVFRRSVPEIWSDTVEYFSQRDPVQIERAKNEPKYRMALVFRWYLGMSSIWAKTGEKERVPDYQVWCGPAMGAFNDWTRGTYLAVPENRRVADVADEIMTGAAFHAGRFSALAVDYRPANIATPRYPVEGALCDRS